MNSNTPARGIKERILEAKTVQEVYQLQNELRSYEYAHPSTHRKCIKAAARRIDQINQNKKTHL